MEQCTLNGAVRNHAYKARGLAVLFDFV